MTWVSLPVPKRTEPPPKCAKSFCTNGEVDSGCSKILNWGGQKQKNANMKQLKLSSKWDPQVLGSILLHLDSTNKNKQITVVFFVTPPSPRDQCPASWSQKKRSACRVKDKDSRGNSMREMPPLPSTSTDRSSDATVVKSCELYRDGKS